jgi:hypothetical protein
MANKVRDRELEYIVLFAPNLTSLEERRIWGDTISNYTLDKYFYVESIGDAHIFCKYNAQGEYIYYNFLERFPQASKEYDLGGRRGNTEVDFKDETIVIPKIYSQTINGNTRTAIFQHPLSPTDSHTGNSYLCYNDVSVPQNCKLEFGIGINPELWGKTTGDGVTFEILIQDDQVFCKHINPRENIEDRKWLDYELDLTDYANKTVNICFVTNPGPNGNNAYDWAYWSQPVIVVSRD